MRLTKRQAISISRKRWKFLAETGASEKSEWPGAKELGYLSSDCALCEYSGQHPGDEDDHACSACPYWQKFPGNNEYETGCCAVGSPFSNWCGAETVEDRKTHAKAFLEQLRQL